ncbi:MAG: PilT protein domain protein [Candidatus Acidoferrum typicum]|nr:PilT protein domain protein [Candidatus Acidoferrum typicum]
MKYLLDTSVFLWSAGAPEKLNKRATGLLTSEASELYLSAASSWEIAIKFALGSLSLTSSPSEFLPRAIRTLALRSLDITHFHSLAAGELPRHHRDPFDRMLIAQARSETMILLTADTAFASYDVETVFCGQ